MNSNNMKQFLHDQAEEMKKHAWIESEKAGHDIGKTSMRDWVTLYAADYRKNWTKEHEVD